MCSSPAAGSVCAGAGKAQTAVPVSVCHCWDPQDPAGNRGRLGPGVMILPGSAARLEIKVMFRCNCSFPSIPPLACPRAGWRDACSCLPVHFASYIFSEAGAAASFISLLAQFVQAGPWGAACSVAGMFV